MKLKTLLTLATLFILGSTEVQAKDFVIGSPNGRLKAVVTDGGQIGVYLEDQPVVSVTADVVSPQFPRRKLTVPTEETPSSHGGNSQFPRGELRETTILSPFYRQASFHSAYREHTIRLRGSLALEVRVYDEGVAYRYKTSNKKETIITDEIADFCFPEASKAWLAYSTNKEKPFAMAFQNTYTETPLPSEGEGFAFLPATIQSGKVKVTILESDLRSYPGMFLSPNTPNSPNTPSIPSLCAQFPKYPKTMARYPWRSMTYVDETEEYIAKSTGARTYPWRIMAITEKDTEMPVNNLVYALAEPNQIGDTSWIKPGKVAWDWWNDWNLKGVDFEAGINTRTYQYYIDFAAKNHLPYVVLDEGWYDSAKGDIMHPIGAVDLQQLIAYGKERGVGIVLWTVFNVLDEHLQEACAQYSEMGIRGFKIDFMDRNDQTAVEMAERIAKVCAEHKLFVDYHGFYAPTGMSRTYPNILNYEGVFGMEEARWAKKDTDMPLYDVTFPYIRMMAGQVDFTPGAMRNGTKENWVECYQNPVSMGTRCHQLACYIVHDTPFTMLCDAPTNYEREQACVDIITSIPDVFDRTIIPLGEMGKYIVTAREKDGNWYIAGQTNWDERTIQLPLDFLGEGTYEATLVTDGINANHNAEDYRIEKCKLSPKDSLTLKLASGGGFVIILKKPAFPS